MTFREFFNKQDQSPTMTALKPMHTGLKVGSPFKDFLKPPSMPDISAPSTKAPLPSMLGSRPASARAIPKAPHRFLPRKNS